MYDADDKTGLKRSSSGGWARKCRRLSERRGLPGLEEVRDGAWMVKPGTVILHSRADDGVPFADSEELARNSGVPASGRSRQGSPIGRTGAVGENGEGVLSMNPLSRTRLPIGVVYALTAAALFGASTPFSKVLLGSVDPWLLAGLLYLGSGCGLSLWLLLGSRLTRKDSQEASLKRADLPWLAGAVLVGGVVGPLLLMLGLATTPAASASLLLNLEGVLTALLAWFVFKENFDRRIALGMALITGGGVLLSWEDNSATRVPWGALGIAGACLAWGIDNNLTRKISGGNPIQIAAVKGLVAGSVNLCLALLIGSRLPGVPTVLAAGAVGLLGYGVSLTCFVLALRHLGTARTGAYFSLAPFVGAAFSLLIFQDGLSILFVVAAALMGVGVWLHLTERHEHQHQHEPMQHEHSHVHDEHHQHEHSPDDPPGEPHSHTHRHEALAHSHAHYPDIHHRHEH
jgi:drug/metabolite transporter (DMT)-like permease